MKTFKITETYTQEQIYTKTIEAETQHQAITKFYETWNPYYIVFDDYTETKVEEVVSES